MKFKPGDKVICIDDSLWSKGKYDNSTVDWPDDSVWNRPELIVKNNIYTIKQYSVLNTVKFVILEENPDWVHHENRFILADPKLIIVNMIKQNAQR